MEEERIAEVRGIASEQNLDAGVVQIVENKLQEFPDGSSYRKKVEDMRRLTAIEYKIQRGENLTRSDLVFLYEIDSSIEGFGYERDPRIKELRENRNPKEDMLVIFDCEPSQIANKKKDINRNTKAYVGELESGIFNVFKKFNIEHVYTSFPEGKIRFDEVEHGGKASEEILKDFKDKEIKVSPDAEYMIRSPDFTILPSPQIRETAEVRVSDLGFSNGATTSEIYKRAEYLGLELCPAELALYKRLKDTDQPLGDWYVTGMKQITARDGYPGVFHLERLGDGLWLLSSWAEPDRGWDPGDRFVFSVRKHTKTL